MFNHLVLKTFYELDLKYENRTSPFTWFMKLKKKTFVEFMIYIKDFK